MYCRGCDTQHGGDPGTVGSCPRCEVRSKSMAAEKKPEGWRKFDALTRKLIQVPKDELEAQVESDRAARRKAKAKKKKRKT